MKKTITLTAICICIIAAMPARAQRPGASFSMGAELAIPTGDLSLVSPLGLGGSGKFLFPVSSNFGFTVSAGYLYYLQKNYFGERVGGFHAIPLKGGIRISANKGFYFEPQFGYTSFGSGGEDAGSDGAFTYAGNIGYLIGNKLDVSMRYESATKDGESIAHVGLRIAYSFSLARK
jgi:hypothetical protein